MASLFLIHVKIIAVFLEKHFKFAILPQTIVSTSCLTKTTTTKLFYKAKYFISMQILNTPDLTVKEYFLNDK